MSTEKVTSVEEVTKYVITCDLCGSNLNVPRYSENRTCEICGRDACSTCQYIPEVDFSFLEGVCCNRCHSIEDKYQEPINETYRERDRLHLAWKTESLSSPATISTHVADEIAGARKD